MSSVHWLATSRKVAPYASVALLRRMKEVETLTQLALSAFVWS